MFPVQVLWYRTYFIGTNTQHWYLFHGICTYLSMSIVLNLVLMPGTGISISTSLLKMHVMKQFRLERTFRISCICRETRLAVLMTADLDFNVCSKLANWQLIQHKAGCAVLSLTLKTQLCAPDKLLQSLQVTSVPLPGWCQQQAAALLASHKNILKTNHNILDHVFFPHILKSDKESAGLERATGTGGDAIVVPSMKWVRGWLTVCLPVCLLDKQPNDPK